MSSTNTPTARAATIPDVLPLDDVTLIGIFEGPNGARCLLRTGTGEIQTLNQDPSEGGLRLAQVGPGWALIEDGTTFRRLIQS